jgi:hypothetical protein
MGTIHDGIGPVVGKRLARFAIAVVLIAPIAVCNPARSDSPRADSAQCEALKTSDFYAIPGAPAHVVEAKSVDRTDDIPGYCEVRGYVAPQVGFAMRLPGANWNKKLAMVGCAGMCGDLYLDKGFCDAPLRRGYACVVSDTGHKGSGGLWAYNNIQAEIDFAYRSTHVTALTSKAIAERYYREAPARSYFMGCSAGGRQGLISAQHFFRDFDGIIVGAPTVDLVAGSTYLLQAVKTARGTGTEPVLPLATLQLLNESVIKKCDLDDGVRDGIIGNPDQCRVELGELACRSKGKRECLTDAQAAAARTIYEGVFTSARERIYPGAAPGSELAWIDFAGESVKAHVADMFRFLLFMPDAGPHWNLASFSVDRDYQRLALVRPLYSASNPDLRSFKNAGGKFIMYHGWNDPLVAPASTIDYYQTVERTMGGRAATEDFLRLFLLPGVNHCSGGAGADAIDLLSAMETWVEQGRAPDELLSAHVDDGGVVPPVGEIFPYRKPPSQSDKIRFTRPVYPFPRRAIYRGVGDANDAASFRPTDLPATSASSP